MITYRVHRLHQGDILSREDITQKPHVPGEDVPDFLEAPRTNVSVHHLQSASWSFGLGAGGGGGGDGGGGVAGDVVAAAAALVAVAAVVDAAAGGGVVRLFQSHGGIVHSPAPRHPRHSRHSRHADGWASFKSLNRCLQGCYFPVIRSLIYFFRFHLYIYIYILFKGSCWNTTPVCIYYYMS